MPLYVCRECANEVEAERRLKSRVCPACDEAELVRVDDRERDEDDGLTYSDPRDERAERRLR